MLVSWLLSLIFSPLHDTAVPAKKVCCPVLTPITCCHSFVRSPLSKDLIWNSFMEWPLLEKKWAVGLLFFRWTRYLWTDIAEEGLPGEATSPDGSTSKISGMVCRSWAVTSFSPICAQRGTLKKDHCGSAFIPSAGIHDAMQVIELQEIKLASFCCDYMKVNKKKIQLLAALFFFLMVIYTPEPCNLQPEIT